LSTTRQNGTKTVLPRTGPDHFWKIVHDEYAGEDQRKWKYLAMLALRENAGWPLEHIGAVFGHPKGHVTRCLQKIKNELRSRFRMSPGLLEIDDDHNETDDLPKMPTANPNRDLNESENRSHRSPQTRPLQPSNPAATGNSWLAHRIRELIDKSCVQYLRTFRGRQNRSVQESKRHTGQTWNPHSLFRSAVLDNTAHDVTPKCPLVIDSQ
jgi:hypothetical protein